MNGLGFLLGLCMGVVVLAGREWIEVGNRGAFMLAIFAVVMAALAISVELA